LFREADKDGDEKPDYGTLEELSQATLIDGVLAGGTKQGYVFQVQVSKENPEFAWMATASPEVPGSTGDRYFGVDSTGVVFYSTETPIPLTADCTIGSDFTPVGR
jgi:hypothetical protein